MKLYISLFALLVTFSSAFAQKECRRVKLEAFVRNAMPGSFPKGQTMENGQTVERPAKPSGSYFIYFYKLPRKATIQTVWLEGNPYRVEVEEIKTPVIVPGSQPGKFQQNDTILTKTKGTVYRVHLKERLDIAPGDRLKEVVKNNAVVMEFNKGKRKYYTITNTWKKLQPVVLQ